MDNLPFHCLSNIYLWGELNYINCLDTLPLLESINTYSIDSEQLLLESNKQASCKYYTINDFKAHFQPFRGITFNQYNAKFRFISVKNPKWS